jgi:flagellar basal-body rod protein FlgC
MINLLTGIDSSGSALNAERVRLEVLAQNIANANTTRGADGKPYQRQQVVFQSVLNDRLNSMTNGELATSRVEIASIQKDARPPRMVYNPGHPDADTQGMVAVPDINIHEEMADLLTASRSFEANLAVIKNARAMAMQTLSIGKR